MDELYNCYPATIAQMPEDVFTAHAFILRLARNNQQLYILALYHYRDSAYPFQVVHRLLADRFNRLPHLVAREGDVTDSVDIFTNQNGCSLWRRLPNP